jgi:hypothetical protein
LDHLFGRPYEHFDHIVGHASNIKFYGEKKKETRRVRIGYSRKNLEKQPAFALSYYGATASCEP